MSNDEQLNLPLDSADEAPEAPQIRAGMILYYDTDGKPGIQSLAQAGTAPDELTPTEITMLCSAALSSNQAEVNAEASMRLQMQMAAGARAQQSGLVKLDGRPA